jgi:hypothetical protein
MATVAVDENSKAFVEVYSKADIGDIGKFMTTDNAVKSRSAVSSWGGGTGMWSLVIPYPIGYGSTNCIILAIYGYYAKNLGTIPPSAFWNYNWIGGYPYRVQQGVTGLVITFNDVGVGGSSNLVNMANGAYGALAFFTKAGWVL